MHIRRYTGFFEFLELPDNIEMLAEFCAALADQR
jgi:hypothetical protein